MERGSASPEKKKMRIGEGSAAAGGVVGAAGGDPGFVAVGRGGRSGAVAGGGRGSAVARGGRSGGWHHAARSGAVGGERRSAADLAAASASADGFDPNFKKRKNRKTTERGLDSWKLGLRPPAFLEYDEDDASEEEPDEDVCDDKQSRDEKSRHVLRKLIAGDWEYQIGFGQFICPFCSHSNPLEYDAMVAHAIGVGSGSQNRPTHVKAKHAAYGLFLQKMDVK